MASSPTSSCCFQGSLYFGDSTSEIKDSYCVEAYIVGTSYPSDKVFVIGTDICGNKLKNNQLIADSFCKSGYMVYVPDFFW